MKAPWFPFYTGDFLASPDVQLMAAHEVGAYLLLLANSWQTDTPGYLTSDEGRLRRICRFTIEQWADSRDLLLSKWPAAENGMLHNPRLVREAEVQVARRDRLAANGAKGGRPAQNQKDSKPKAKNNLQVMPEEPIGFVEEPTGLLSQPQSHSTSVEEEPAPEPSPLKAETGGQKLVGSANPARQQALATNDGDGEQGWQDSPLAKPHGFQAICEGNGYPGIDYEHYRKQALDAARNESPPRPRTAPQWRSWVRKYLNYESKGGPLLQPSATMPTVPTPRHELPQPGQEVKGQIIAIQGVSGDQNMNRMLVATYQKQFPTATIHAIVPR